jgi:hypothetical protein
VFGTYRSECVNYSTAGAIRKLNGRAQVVLSDFDHFEPADEHFDAIYALGPGATLESRWMGRADHDVRPHTGGADCRAQASRIPSLTKRSFFETPGEVKI